MDIKGLINILIVDDSEDNLTLLETILENPEYNIVKASSGKEALVFLSNIEFALVIMDVQMPGLSGLEVAKIIKENQNISAIPIIFVTANAKLSKTILQGYKSGAVDYIFKPVDSEILSAKVAVFAELFKKNKEVQIAKEIAIKANESKSKFLAIISHEIRSPISSIIGLADLLLDTKLSDEQRSYSNSIINSSQNLLSIINDLLDFSKIDANKLELEETEFSLIQIIEQLISLFSSTLKNKNLELATFINPNLPSLVKGDSVRLYQILTNLVSNAVKFTEFGTIAISSSLVEETKTQVLIKFSVSDTGKGIVKANQALLFEPYIQEDSSISRKFGGTGLGLSICKKLVTLMGGEISLESEIDKGTTFFFTAKFLKILPLNDSSSNETPILSNISALVIGESSTLVTTLVKQLRVWEINAKQIESIAKLLEYLASNSINQHTSTIVIWNISNINDEIMAEITVVLEEIKSFPNFPALILLIPFWEQNSFQELSLREQDIYLTKPLQPSKLLEHFKNLALSLKTQSPKIISNQRVAKSISNKALNKINSKIKS
ncbi:MAG: response regulator [Acidobacteria bacterium]|nr:response regulator [Acidobacteriota bacterium]